MRTTPLVLSGLTLFSIGAMPAAPAGGTTGAVAAATHHARVQGDIDGDHRSDLVVSVKGGFRVYYTSATVAGSHVQNVTLPDHQTPSSLAAGDFNGDGYSDLAVGDPHSNYNPDDQTYDGAIVLYDGGPHGLKTGSLTQIPGPAHSGDVYGQLLIALPLNGARYQDLVEIPDQRGGVKLFVGRPKGLRPAPLTLLGAGKHHYDNASGTFGGFAVGDVNGDGDQDLVIGRPYEGRQLGHGEDFQGNEGEVEVVYGTAQGFGDHTTVLHGVKVGTHFRSLGASIAVANVNGDKYADIVAGAPGTDNSNGSVAVVYGAKHGPVATDSTVVTAASKGVPAVKNREGVDDLGTAVGTGDINGDGYADVVVGVPDGHLKHAPNGTALVFYGSKTGLTTAGSQALSLHTDFPKLPSRSGGFGTSLTVYNPQGARFASVAVNAPLYHSKGNSGVVGIYHGTAHGLDVVHATRLIGVGQERNYSTGGAIAP